MGRVLLDPRLGSNFGFHLMHYLAVKMYANCIIIFIGTYMLYFFSCHFIKKYSKKVIFFIENFHDLLTEINELNQVPEKIH